MRILGLTALAFVPSLVASATVHDHHQNVSMKDTLETTVKACAKKHGVTREEIMKMHDYSEEVSERREYKCFVACLLYGVGEFEEVADLPEKNTLDLYFSLTFKPEERKLAKDIFKKCYDSTVPRQIDHCEYLHGLVKCYVKGANAAHLKPMLFWDAERSNP